MQHAPIPLEVLPVSQLGQRVFILHLSIRHLTFHLGDSDGRTVHGERCQSRLLKLKGASRTSIAWGVCLGGDGRNMAAMMLSLKLRRTQEATALVRCLKMVP